MSRAGGTWGPSWVRDWGWGWGPAPRGLPAPLSAMRGGSKRGGVKGRGCLGWVTRRARSTPASHAADPAARTGHTSRSADPHCLLHQHPGVGTSTPGWAPEPWRTHRTHSLCSRHTAHTHGTPLAPHRKDWTRAASTRPPRHASDPCPGHQTFTRPIWRAPDPHHLHQTPTPLTRPTLHPPAIRHTPDPHRTHWTHPACTRPSPCAPAPHLLPTEPKRFSQLCGALQELELLGDGDFIA